MSSIRHRTGCYSISCKLSYVCLMTFQTGPLNSCLTSLHGYNNNNDNKDSVPNLIRVCCMNLFMPVHFTMKISLG
uniref:Uncharacterized protein n=1 Tax=Rhizophora mucronata TaxID=61149 RepID=A0A2P2Q3D2_RHIMU